jgi:hypothetical protein
VLRRGRLNEWVDKLRALPSEHFIRDLVRSVDDFVGSAPQFDDLTALLATVIARKAGAGTSETQQHPI